MTGKKRLAFVRDRGARLLMLASVAFAFITGCLSARRGEPLHGPIQLSNVKAQHGQVVFMRNCQKCHPGGDAGLGPAINNKPLPKFLMKFQVRHGLGAMPSFSKDRIASADLDDLMAYIKQIRKYT